MRALLYSKFLCFLSPGGFDWGHCMSPDLSPRLQPVWHGPLERCVRRAISRCGCSAGFASTSSFDSRSACSWLRPCQAACFRVVSEQSGGRKAARRLSVPLAEVRDVYAFPPAHFAPMVLCKGVGGGWPRLFVVASESPMAKGASQTRAQHSWSSFCQWKRATCICGLWCVPFPLVHEGCRSTAWMLFSFVFHRTVSIGYSLVISFILSLLPMRSLLVGCGFLWHFLMPWLWRCGFPFSSAFFFLPPCGQGCLVSESSEIQVCIVGPSEGFFPECEILEDALFILWCHHSGPRYGCRLSSFVTGFRFCCGGVVRSPCCSVFSSYFKSWFFLLSPCWPCLYVLRSLEPSLGSAQRYVIPMCVCCCCCFFFFFFFFCGHMPVMLAFTHTTCSCASGFVYPAFPNILTICSVLFGHALQGHCPEGCWPPWSSGAQSGLSWQSFEASFPKRCSGLCSGGSYSLLFLLPVSCQRYSFWLG